MITILDKCVRGTITRNAKGWDPINQRMAYGVSIEPCPRCEGKGCPPADGR